MKRSPNPKVELASGEYDLAKYEARRAGVPHTVTYRTIERRFGLRPRTLSNYRANYLSRTHRLKLIEKGRAVRAELERLDALARRSADALSFGRT